MKKFASKKLITKIQQSYRIKNWIAEIKASNKLFWKNFTNEFKVTEVHGLLALFLLEGGGALSAERPPPMDGANN